MPEITRPQKITLGEMRAAGVRGILVYCADYRCAHAAALVFPWSGPRTIPQKPEKETGRNIAVFTDTNRQLSQFGRAPEVSGPQIGWSPAKGK
jgi:hypothetical protein